MNAQDRRRLDMLEDELNRLRNQVLVRPGYARNDMRPIIIIGGQSFGAVGGITTYGITKFTGGTLSGIANGTYDPGTVNASTGAETGAPTPNISSWPTGLGYGTSWNGASYERVIVCNDGRGTSATALIGGWSDDTTYAPTDRQVCILSGRVVTVSKLDASLVTCWSPDLA